VTAIPKGQNVPMLFNEGESSQVLLLGMHRNENSWPKLKTENEETKAENRYTEINYQANY
jgi:hypothetical protein